MFDTKVKLFLDRVVSEVCMNRQEQKQMTYEKILNNAKTVFGNFTYAQASMNAIAKKAGVSKGILYHHFSDKDELYMLCVNESMNDFILYIETHYKPADHFEDNINLFFKVRKNYFQEDSDLSKIFQQSLLHHPQHLKEGFRKAHQPVSQLNEKLLYEILEDAPLSGALSVSDVMQYIELFMKSLNESSQTDSLSMEVRELKIENMMDIILYGILRRV